MNILLTTDLHLTDNPIEEYRWKIFQTLLSYSKEYSVSKIYFLGDIFDRKDRHTGRLVNKVIACFKMFGKETTVTIISGNHDQPINGPYYWEFLNETGIDYITQPLLESFSDNDIWLLPFSANPLLDWSQLALSQAKAIFMHQTVQGAIVDGGRAIPNTPHPMPELPSIPIFSGDVHRPQDIQGITYIGTPHPVRFSETWPNRVILVKDFDFKNYESLWLDSTSRGIIDIKSTEELKTLSYKKGDQIRVRYKLAPESLTNWANEQEIIKQWAKENNIFLASVEAAITGAVIKSETDGVSSLELLDHSDIVRLYCRDNSLSEDITEMGLGLLQESI